jgi:thioredoxin 1
MEAVTEATFQAEVLEHDGPVLVDFWADWCGPCKMVAPVLEQIAAEHPKLKIVKVDTEAYGGLANYWGVRALPTLLVFQGGQSVHQIVGAKPKAVLLHELAGFLN